MWIMFYVLEDQFNDECNIFAAGIGNKVVELETIFDLSARNTDTSFWNRPANPLRYPTNPDSKS
jgi:hypothetical protein